ncbi:hypothetical protein K449DRAFT_432854 [Hypoxylon sp. EC38]|nr:hypothetical protein K449DRAFT_432854 [Hypoxylon sp. EC38]
MTDLMMVFQATDEITDAMFAVTTQKLGIPIAQVLFPRFRKPLIVVEDPLEVEDIIVRRHNEFNKGAILHLTFTRLPLSCSTFGGLRPRRYTGMDFLKFMEDINSAPIDII